LLLQAGASLAFWVLTSLAARVLMDDSVEAARQGIYSGTCLLLCMVPTDVTLWWGRRALAASPEQQLAAVMGGTGIRMFAVLVAGWLLWSKVAYYGDSSFWNWLLACYLFTLALEITLLLVGRPAAAPKP
jgi:hypothetical protein